MKTLLRIVILLILVTADSCIIDYIPKIGVYEEVLVVEGLITDQPGVYTVKVSKSEPLWNRKFIKPLTGCKVSISDDKGQTYNLKEVDSSFGVYVTDQASFRGVIGRVYTLHIKTTTESPNLSYESQPMKMIPVPPIDNIYYEKKTFRQANSSVEGCNIYLNTHDPSNNCRFYRWEYSETWEFHLPFNFPNNVCWLSNNSGEIIIKNTSLHAETNVIGQPVLTITDPIDRLSVKYSILVKQFSLNEDEYFYWERLKNSLDQTGGLYDLIPNDIPNNIFCLEEPNRKVLGYFSVSAMSSKRLFITDKFAGLNTMYASCTSDTFFTTKPDTLKDIWIIFDNSKKVPPAVIYTKNRGCVDCTSRGTNIKPIFWD